MSDQRGVPAERLDQAAAILRSARRVVALTGAGVSAESGVPTFREKGGLWEQVRIEDVATPRGFQKDPERVWAFYNARLENLGQVKPNPGHVALARLEGRYEAFALVTQNIDGLHRAAGSRNVLEVHGDLWQVRCTRCGKVSDRTGEVLAPLPRCGECNGLLRPNVVWFEEELPSGIWAAACEAVAACDCLLVVGTSAAVYPAAGLVWDAKHHGAAVIEVNLEVTDASAVADVSLLGKSGEILPRLVATLDEDASICEREPA